VGAVDDGRTLTGAPAREGDALAAVQCVVIVAMTVVVLGVGDVLTFEPPTWLAWATLALAAMTAVANGTSPSQAERRLCMPVAIAVLLCAALAVSRSGNWRIRTDSYAKL